MYPINYIYHFHLPYKIEELFKPCDTHGECCLLQKQTIVTLGL